MTDDWSGPLSQVIATYVVWFCAVMAVIGLIARWISKRRR